MNLPPRMREMPASRGLGDRVLLPYTGPRGWPTVLESKRSPALKLIIAYKLAKAPVMLALALWLTLAPNQVYRVALKPLSSGTQLVSDASREAFTAPADLLDRRGRRSRADDHLAAAAILCRTPV